MHKFNDVSELKKHLMSRPNTDPVDINDWGIEDIINKIMYPNGEEISEEGGAFIAEALVNTAPKVREELLNKLGYIPGPNYDAEVEDAVRDCIMGKVDLKQKAITASLDLAQNKTEKFQNLVKVYEVDLVKKALEDTCDIDQVNKLWKKVLEESEYFDLDDPDSQEVGVDHTKDLLGRVLINIIIKALHESTDEMNDMIDLWSDEMSNHVDMIEGLKLEAMVNDNTERLGPSANHIIKILKEAVALAKLKELLGALSKYSEELGLLDDKDSFHYLSGINLDKLIVKNMGSIKNSGLETELKRIKWDIIQKVYTHKLGGVRQELDNWLKSSEMDLSLSGGEEGATKLLYAISKCFLVEGADVNDNKKKALSAIMQKDNELVSDLLYLIKDDSALIKLLYDIPDFKIQDVAKKKAIIGSLDLAQNKTEEFQNLVKVYEVDLVKKALEDTCDIDQVNKLWKKVLEESDLDLDDHYSQEVGVDLKDLLGRVLINMICRGNRVNSDSLTAWLKGSDKQSVNFTRLNNGNISEYELLHAVIHFVLKGVDIKNPDNKKASLIQGMSRNMDLVKKVRELSEKIGPFTKEIKVILDQAEAAAKAAEEAKAKAATRIQKIFRREIKREAAARAAEEAKKKREALARAAAAAAEIQKIFRGGKGREAAAKAADDAKKKREAAARAAKEAKKKREAAARAAAKVKSQNAHVDQIEAQKRAVNGKLELFIEALQDLEAGKKVNLNHLGIEKENNNFVMIQPDLLFEERRSISSELREKLNIFAVKNPKKVIISNGKCTLGGIEVTGEAIQTVVNAKAKADPQKVTIEDGKCKLGGIEVTDKVRHEKIVNAQAKNLLAWGGVAPSISALKNKMQQQLGLKGDEGNKTIPLMLKAYKHYRENIKKNRDKYRRKIEDLQKIYEALLKAKVMGAAYEEPKLQTKSGLMFLNRDKHSKQIADINKAARGIFRPRGG